MKKSVVDIDDLQKMVLFFKSRIGTWLGKLLIKWFSVDKVNRIHANHCHLRGAAFTSAMLQDPLMDIKYQIHHAERLDTLPEGAFITVSNHPVGSIDGIILIDIMAARRPDFCVMVNGILTNIGAMEDNFIPVKPDSNKKGADLRNVNGVRLSLERIKEGHPMGFFPAGAISFYDKQVKAIRDLPWTHSVIRLIRKTDVPVYPIHFDFVNTRFFYWLGRISWKIRTLRIPAEAFNKKKKVLDVYIGEPIDPWLIRQIQDDTELARFLYEKTYNAKK
ncbi:MAG: lysophospholipid acyltransferase family protein [Tannerellaceae bacterium]|nr:lysophospholipid acyltransferase family protein [Tannerellaceae bacterium]